MSRKDGEQMIALGRKLWKKESKKFSGVCRIAYLTDVETGETMIFCPCGTTAETILHFCNSPDLDIYEEKRQENVRILEEHLAKQKETQE